VIAMTRPIILALAISACVSPSTTYERGTLRPLPARPQPKVGPTYDPHVAPLPPQPQPKPGRVLPQTPETQREPGLWAANIPDDDDSLGGTRLGGMEIPYPLDAAMPHDKAPARMCGLTMTATIERGGFSQRWLSHNPHVRHCLSARLYERCAAHLLKRHDKALADGYAVNPRDYAAAKSTDATARDFRADACHRISVSPDGDALVAHIGAEWERTVPHD
jgi:hypothetical protein